jgi:hypothetical protein
VRIYLNFKKLRGVGVTIFIAAVPYKIIMIFLLVGMKTQEWNIAAGIVCSYLCEILSFCVEEIDVLQHTVCKGRSISARPQPHHSRSSLRIFAIVIEAAQRKTHKTFGTTFLSRYA